MNISKNKKIFILLLISIFAFSVCYAAENSDHKDFIDIVKQYWNLTVDWFNNDLKPWIEKNITTEAKEGFRQTFKQFIDKIPDTFNSLMDKLGQVFK